MRKKSVKNDWNKVIENDFTNINETINEEWIITQSETVYKKYIKEKVRQSALIKFNEKKATHSKVKDLVFEDL